MLQRLHIISAMKLYMVKYYYNAMKLYIVSAMKLYIIIYTSAIKQRPCCRGFTFFKCNETMMPLPSPLDVGDCLIFHNSRASLH